MAEIEYFYSAQSAYAYLGSARLMDIARVSGRRILHRPVDVVAVVAAARPGGFAGKSQKNRDYFFRREAERWSEFLEVAFKGPNPPNHSGDITLANCLLIACQTLEQDTDRLAHGFLQAHWRDYVDLENPENLASVIAANGMDPDQLMDLAQSDDILATYKDYTDEAIERSVFGSPTYFVDGDMFYGQDRLDLVRRAIDRPFRQTW